MKVSWLPLFLLSFTLFSLFLNPAVAVKKSYIVYLGGHSHGLEASEIDFNHATDSHHELLSSHLGSRERAKEAIFYSYNKHINGFSAMLEDYEAEAISKDPRVISVFLNRGRKLQTTRSWQFLGVEKLNGQIPMESIWKKARFGEDTIIATLDSGVWPESPSFSDDGMGLIPARWKGSCQDNSKEGVPCNNKLIGAKGYDKDYKAFAESVNVTVNATSHTTRDTEGHGSHTLSTAGGNFVPRASLFGFAEGTVKGGSPKARLASYKVCWTPIDDAACFDGDILAAFDDAIYDGVDVLSLSIAGGAATVLEDSISIGSFHAVQRGITVVCAAGNSGPGPNTVDNVAPWILTVGASTTDRKFQSDVVLGNNKTISGTSRTRSALPAKKYYPLISALDAKASNATDDAGSLCYPNSLDPQKVKGKILVCLRGVTAMLDKGVQAQLAGAVGMILCNSLEDGYETFAEEHVLPATHLNYNDSVTLFQYLNSTKSPVGYLTPAHTQLHVKPAPVIADFSSRGPNNINPEILKPDIIAPGVDILASFTKATGYQEGDNRTVQFNILSGTSMATPHVSGVVGLLKTLHPDWSPAAMKSAIMTSATVLDNTKETIRDSTFSRATPFSYGAGHMWPDRAADPGLVYDLNTNDYLNYLCANGYSDSNFGPFAKQLHKCPKSFSIMDLNYPSITVPELSDSITVTRTVKNVGTASTYHVTVQQPDGVSVSVEPKVLRFKEIGEEKNFKVTLEVKTCRAYLDYTFGSLTWSDGNHRVRSPLVVKAKWNHW